MCVVAQYEVNGGLHQGQLRAVVACVCVVKDLARVCVQCSDEAAEALCEPTWIFAAHCDACKGNASILLLCFPKC